MAAPLLAQSEHVLGDSVERRLLIVFGACSLSCDIPIQLGSNRVCRNEREKKTFHPLHALIALAVIPHCVHTCPMRAIGSNARKLPVLNGVTRPGQTRRAIRIGTRNVRVKPSSIGQETSSHSVRSASWLSFTSIGFMANCLCPNGRAYKRKSSRRFWILSRHVGRTVHPSAFVQAVDERVLVYSCTVAKLRDDQLAPSFAERIHWRRGSPSMNNKRHLLLFAFTHRF